MCGIVGQISFSGARPASDDIKRALRSIEGRGPDASEIWSDDDAMLGHCSLDVMKRATGGKPVLSDDSRYSIVIDGELYNAEELQPQIADLLGENENVCHADLILAAYKKWGEACTEKLTGMYAFAIWDRKEKRLFAVRDRIGVKPFYYSESSPKGFIFASRPRAILNVDQELSSEVDPQACRLYMESGYIPYDYSIYRSMRKLAPAHRMTVDAGGVRVERYWDLKTIEPVQAWASRREEDLLEELDELVFRCVPARMPKDESIGTFLSGGIDSSIVTAVYAKTDPSRVKAFTMGFEDAKYDESPYAKGVAQHLGVEHRMEVLSSDTLLNLMPDFLKEFDEPYFDNSVFPNMAVARLARRHVRVASTGDGGDECFGGYHYFEIANALDRVYKLPHVVRKMASSVLRRVPHHRLNLLAGAIAKKERVAAVAFSRSIRKDFGLLFKDEVVSDDSTSMEELFCTAAESMPKNLSLAEKAMRMDLSFTLPDEFLQKADGSSMAFSLELRDPLVDHRIVEWSQQLPLSWKLRDGQTKYLWRKFAYQYVPKEKLSRPKHGFEVPVPRWLRGPMKEWAQERCNDTHLLDEVGLDHKKVVRLLNLHLDGTRDTSPLLWATLMLLEFLDHRKEYLL